MVIDYRSLLPKEGEQIEDNMLFYRTISNSDLPQSKENSWAVMLAGPVYRQGESQCRAFKPKTMSREIVEETTLGYKWKGFKKVSQPVIEKKEKVSSVDHFQIIGDSSDGKRVIHVAVNEGRSTPAKLIIEDDGLPKLRRQPITTQDMVKLLEVDPRYISKLDVGLIQGAADRKALAEAVSRGLKNVLTMQASLGVPYSQEEHDEREKYTADVKAKYMTYEKNWQSVNASEDSAEGAGESC